MRGRWERELRDTAWLDREKRLRELGCCCEWGRSAAHDSAFILDHERLRLAAVNLAPSVWLHRRARENFFAFQKSISNGADQYRNISQRSGLRRQSLGLGTGVQLIKEHVDVGAAPPPKGCGTCLRSYSACCQWSERILPDGALHQSRSPRSTRLGVL
jgi:hypothetical protein